MACIEQHDERKEEGEGEGWMHMAVQAHMHWPCLGLRAKILDGQWW